MFVSDYVELICCYSNRYWYVLLCYFFITWNILFGIHNLFIF